MSDTASWRASRLKRFEAAAISIAGYRLISALGATFRGLVDRVEAVGGSITILSPLGEGTSLAVELPESPEPATVI